MAVEAIVVVHNGATWLAQCLDGVAAQTLPPARLVIVDVASTDTSNAIAHAHSGVRRAIASVEVVRLDARVPLGRAVERGIATLPEAKDPTASWVWVIHDDSVPRGNALAQLLQAGLRSKSVGVAGPKLVSWDDPRRLVEMGIQITRTGRRLGSPVRGEADQGQYDHRADVLAVSTSGMLVRRSVLDDIGGFDSAFVDHGADLDFGWRAQLAGHRVIVVPAAVVRDASASLEGRRPGVASPRELERRGRRAARQVTLARCSPFAAPFLAIWMALSALVASLTLLVAKRPRQAWRELTDVSALLHPFATLGARWRGRRTKRLRRDHLGTLFVAPSVAARTTIDHIQDAITPERARARREAAATTETGPVADESESLDNLPASLPRRVVTHPGFLAVAAVLVASVAAWRDTIRAGALSPTNAGVAGGELRPVATDSAGLWHAFRDAWHGAGLGTGAQSGPHLAVLSALTWLAEQVPGVAESRSSAGVTIAWLLFLTPVLAAWSSYLAARVVTSSRPARALAALTWGTAGVAVSGLGEGRVTVAVVHVLLPFVLAGFCLAARRDGTFTATFATALATAVLGAFAPPLLALAAVAALVLLVLGPGMRRARALVLLVVPGALLGPWIVRFVDDPRLLLSGPGLVATSVDGSPWGVLGHVLGETAATTWVAWLGAPLVLLGIVGLGVRGRSRAESVGMLAGGLLAVVGLAGALASERVVLGSAETGVGQSAPAHLWAGLGVQLWWAGLLVGVLAGSRVVLESVVRPGRRWGFVVAVVVAAVAVLPVLAGAAVWGVQGIGRTLSVGQATLPAVAIEQGSGSLGNRLLLLRPSDDVVDFVLAGQEPGELLRDLDRPADADDAPLVDAVANIVGGRGADSLDSKALARLGIGFVQVAGAADSPLARRLDASEGLSRLGSSARGILWKVQPLPGADGAEAAAAPSRARLVDADGRLVATVPTVGPHAAVDTVLPAGAAPRLLVLAEPREWSRQARVTFDGAELQPVAGAAQPTYAVPGTSGTLEVDLAAAQPWWRLGQAVLLAFVVFMALPFGNRRSRRRT
ncbi:glycosyltransferase family 2 protein [Terrabacter aerolatus]|uniref:Glycosyl transferase n=1 Tax=Terrabacter aerolatus TaxID=422442 RepID=A0A512D279_9MICO|nr:glycosyltransferase family 2 protein [Terrabacter aerolatus]GEO30350.1 glycosyl transferase [Terrabacter aerolatus]